MIEFMNGKIFVEGVETIDAELIGMAVLDFVEANGDADNIELVAEYDISGEPEMDLVPTSEFLKNMPIEFEECKGDCKRKNCDGCGGN